MTGLRPAIRLRITPAAGAQASRRKGRLMRTRKDIEGLAVELEEIIGLADPMLHQDVYEQLQDDPDFAYLSAVSDALDWVLDEIPTDEFLSEYLDLDELRGKIRAATTRSGKPGASGGPD